MHMQGGKLKFEAGCEGGQQMQQDDRIDTAAQTKQDMFAPTRQRSEILRCLVKQAIRRGK